MIDPLTGATTFATIVQLIALYRQEMGARKDLTHREFIEWLDEHRHEEVRELITHTYHLQSQVDDLLRQEHAEILNKLDQANQFLVEILARLKWFGPVAEVVVPELGLSSEAIGLLRLLGRSKTGALHILGEDQFVVDACMYAPAAPKFFHDDLSSLVIQDLFTIGYSGGGQPYYRLTRRGDRILKMLPLTLEDSEPDYQPGA